MAEVCSQLETWCGQNGYKDVTALEGKLNLDPKVLPLPPCKECDEYEECLSCLDDRDQEPDGMKLHCYR